MGGKKFILFDVEVFSLSVIFEVEVWIFCFRIALMTVEGGRAEEEGCEKKNVPRAA